MLLQINIILFGILEIDKIHNKIFFLNKNIVILIYH